MREKSAAGEAFAPFLELSAAPFRTTVVSQLP